MDMYMRRKCQECRLKKCKAVEMLAEYKCHCVCGLVFFFLGGFNFFSTLITWQGSHHDHAGSQGKAHPLYWDVLTPMISTNVGSSAA